MKELHIWERIFHYFKIWCFVLALAIVAFSLFNVAGLVQYADEEWTFDPNGVVANFLGLEEAGALDVFAYALLKFTSFAQFPFFLVIGGIVFWLCEHIFKKVQVIRIRDGHAKGCGCCKEEEGDAQVEKIMKWKDFYNEGIITEREFIQKRNEILGLHK